MQILEYRTQAQGLPDLLLYDCLIDDGVLVQRDGSFLAAWSFAGPDMASATHEEMAVLSARLNSVLRLGSGWMVHCDAIRFRAPQYPEAGHFPDPVTGIIDEERRQQFLTAGAHYESEYFLALTYLPPAKTEEKLKGWMFDGPTQTEKSSAEKMLAYFNSRVVGFEDVFSSLFRVARLRRITFADENGFSHAHDGLLRYVRRAVTGENHPFALPEIPAYLNDIIASQDFVGGIEPQIGRNHIRVVAIDGFPRMSFPGILGALDTLPMEYRWNTRAILLDPEEARRLLDKVRRRWTFKIRGFLTQVFQTGSGALNVYAQDMADDAEEAMGLAASGEVQFALYSTNVLCLDTDLERLAENIALVVKTIQNLGFACRVETVNAIEAWRGSLPGDGYRNVRRVVLHTLNLADLLPITSVWTGLHQNPSPLMPANSPPLLYAATTGRAPFRFNLHVGDLPHTLMVGPPGSGKSTALGLVTAQWFRFPRAQVFAFDKGYSLFVLTKASGGEFYDIGGEKTALAFCPLREIDGASDLAWAVDWLEILCSLQGLTVTPKHRSALFEGVVKLRESPTRTLTELSANVQDLELRGALQYYTLDGPMGHLVDADQDMLGEGRLLAFEMENLMSLGEKAVVAVLLYLFRRIEKRLDGSPTLVVLDEAWVYLRHSLFRERLRDWLKTLRKLNGAVLLATQNLSDIFNSPIRDVVLESCPTKILLPNAEAANPASQPFYTSIGLNEREIQIIQTSFPKRDYYVVSPLGRRLISLDLGGVALSFVGVNARDELRAVEKIMEAHPDHWQTEWLKTRGLVDWADYYEQLTMDKRRIS
jgi:type IV secretion system protein TrbE